MDMKIAILAVLAMVVFSACSLSNITGKSLIQEPLDQKCEMPKPVEVGDCGKVFGIYFDKESNSCRTLNACSIEGEIPFPLTLDVPMNTCTELCVRN